MEGEEKPGEGGLRTVTPEAREVAARKFKSGIEKLQEGGISYRINPNKPPNLTPDQEEFFEGKIPSTPTNKSAVERPTGGAEGLLLYLEVHFQLTSKRDGLESQLFRSKGFGIISSWKSYF